MPFITLESGERGCMDDLEKLKPGSVISIFIDSRLIDERLRQVLKKENYLLIFEGLEEGTDADGQPTFIKARAIGEFPQNRVWDFKYLSRVDIVARFNTLAADWIIKLVKENNNFESRIERIVQRHSALLE